MTYRLRSEDLLRRVAYRGALPFAAPVAIDVLSTDGTPTRAAYVEGSMQAHPGAHYIIEDELYELGRDGVLRPVASEGRKAA